MKHNVNSDISLTVALVQILEMKEILMQRTEISTSANRLKKNSTERYTWILLIYLEGYTELVCISSIKKYWGFWPFTHYAIDSTSSLGGTTTWTMNDELPHLKKTASETCKAGEVFHSYESQIIWTFFSGLNNTSLNKRDMQCFYPK